MSMTTSPGLDDQAAIDPRIGPTAAAVAESVQILLPERCAPAVAKLAGVAPQLARYTLVSAFALGLDTALFMILTASSIAPAAIAGAIGYGFGLLLHFALSSRYVFECGSTGKTPARLLAEFAASGIVSLLITALMIALAYDVIGLPALAAKAAAVAASFLAVFILRRNVVFAKASRD